MKKKNQLVVTLNIFQLRSIIAEVFDEKIGKITKKTKEKQENISLISRLQAGKMFQVSTTTIDKWRKFKVLPPEIKVASRVFFDRDQIFEALKRKQKNPSDFLNS
jgi:hypothetical protein